MVLIYLGLAAVTATLLSWLPRFQESTFLRVVATMSCLAVGIIFIISLNFFGLILIMAGVLQGGTVDELIDADFEKFTYGDKKE